MTDQKAGAGKVQGDQVAGDKTVETQQPVSQPGGDRPGQAVQQPDQQGAPTADD